MINDNEKPGQDSAPSPEGQTMTIDQAIDLAVEHQNAGRFPDAENLYNHILQAIPNHPIATHLLGVLAYQVGKMELAVDFISKALAIQPDYGEARQVFGDTVTDLSPHFTNFADTAAAISHLDLIVSVDTSIVHLAGFMGRPVWTLLPFIPDWRWLMERDDSPWYPSMSLFRQQTRGDWHGVLEAVCQTLMKNR